MKCSTSSCGSGCATPAPCPCPPGGNPEFDTLEKVVNCYWQRHQELAVERSWYAALDSFPAAIEEAAQALADENAAYDVPEVIPRAALKSARTRLLEATEQLAATPDFEALHGAVAAAIGDLPGLTPALVYLTALRIGLHAGRVPELIDLESGAREGAAALVDLPPTAATFSRSLLPAIFRHPDLPTEEVQGCLSVCRHQLQWLRANGRLGRE